MHLLVPSKMTGIDCRPPHQVFLFLEVVLRVGRQFALHLLQRVEAYRINPRQQIAETVDQIDEDVVLPVALGQACFEMRIPMKGFHVRARSSSVKSSCRTLGHRPRGWASHCFVA